jgi:hypothetical protein
MRVNWLAPKPDCATSSRSSSVSAKSHLAAEFERLGEKGAAREDHAAAGARAGIDGLLDPGSGGEGLSRCRA